VDHIDDGEISDVGVLDIRQSDAGLA